MVWFFRVVIWDLVTSLRISQAEKLIRASKLIRENILPIDYERGVRDRHPWIGAVECGSGLQDKMGIGERPTKDSGLAGALDGQGGGGWGRRNFKPGDYTTLHINT